MGGNALKNTHTRRYDKDEYFALEAEVVGRLKQDFPARLVAPILAYRDKPTFGDMDVLFQSDEITFDLRQYLTDTFHPAEMVKNGNCLSFEYKELQVDLLLTPKHIFETSFNYFAWNDLGNLLGRISHMMGMKLGHDGFWYMFRIDTYAFDDVEAAMDWRVVLPALGYDYDRWSKGFDTMEDMFQFVVSSQFFNKDIFLLHNRNNASRTRDSKRKTYQEFLKWVDTPAAGVLPACPYREDKREWLPYLFSVLPGFEPKFREVEARFNLVSNARERFNGELVTSLTGLTGTELGAFMKKFREGLGGKEAVTNWVASSSDEEVKNRVLQALAL
jgi:hypothetical protein